MNPPAIRLAGVTKRYGDFPAVRDLSLEIDCGEIFGFVGPNGAGKTTTIRMLAGLAYPTTGAVQILGKDYASEAFRIKKIVGYIPDRPYLYDRLTGREYLEFVLSVHGVDGGGNDPINEHLKMFDLDAWADQLVESYSHGMKQRLTFCAALIHRPRVLIVDEPMVGLDPKGVRLVKALFRDLAAGGIAVFVSTHNLEIAEQVCHRIGIIHEGSLVACDSIEGLRRRSELPGSGLEEIFMRLTTEEVR
jgi:ABC-2 type transport system ATP-binding protein